MKLRLCRQTARWSSGLILGLRPANERRRYFVTQSNAVSHWLGTSLESALKFTQASQLFVWHIEAWLKWPPFCRRYLQMNFFQWKCFNFEYKMIEKCFWGFNNRWQNSIGAVSAAGHRIGAKPLLEPMLTNYPNPVDAYPGQVFVLYVCSHVPVATDWTANRQVVRSHPTSGACVIIPYLGGLAHLAQKRPA